MFKAVPILAALLIAASAAVAAHPGDGASPNTPQSPYDEKAALAASQGAIGRVLADYAFTTGEGKAVRLSDYRGKPLVVSLIYTSCYHICPTTTRHLAKVVRIAREALGADSFRVLTIGFDSARDTPAAMRQYARLQDVGLAGWDFVGTDAKTMEGLGQDLGFQYFPSAHGFDHLIQATVLDGDGRIYRQVYGMSFETPLLAEPLKELVFGAPPSDSLLAGLTSRVRLFCTVYDPATDRYRFDYSLFLGGAIGLTSLGLMAVVLVREWRRGRTRA